MSDPYVDFLSSKRATAADLGASVLTSDINPILFPFQRDLVRWAVRKGRAAIFADTGLGKTLMQLEWARLIGVTRVLVVAPLGVALQTVREAKKIALNVKYSRDGKPSPITITNYELISHFDHKDFGAVVLDESSILKSLDGKTRAKLTAAFENTRYRLCCTATPAPNDISEIANHAEFLGVMSRVDMLATFFIHDDEGWRLKGHAKDPFYRWLASWGMSVRRPSDLGYSDEGYVLPGLCIEPLWVPVSMQTEGALFFTGMKGISDRARIRNETIDARVSAAAELISKSPGQWLVWCGLNSESAALARTIPGSVEVSGSDSPERKVAAMEAFQSGEIRVLVTKPRIAGFGMNFQNCHQMAFVGLSDSWEAYYQCIRRCYRFGQKQTVRAVVVLSDAESAIYENIMRKEREATGMAERLVEHVREFEREEISANTVEFKYETATNTGDGWKLMLGDSAERLSEVEGESVDLSVFSPPFMSLYTYSPTERDMGNSRDPEQFFAHFRFVIDHLLRVTKPGRNCCVHVAQVPAMLVRDGYIGMKDFRGRVIEEFEKAKWIYHGEVCIDKDPQAQAIRTKSKGLLFTQLRKDASWLRPALADYILVFRKPGVNAVPIQPDITNEEWIEWARPIWYGIQESDTLNTTEGRDSKDERHICPLQLGAIERCVRLWSNASEVVLSPFAGIGSEGYVSLSLGRKFIGCELKRSYFDAAIRNLDRAHQKQNQPNLFQDIAV